MKSRILTLMAAAFTMTGLLGLAAASTREADSKSTKEIMGALNKGPNSASGKLKKALGAGDWKTVKAEAAKFDELTPDMAQNDPPKGDKESWAKLCQAYAADAKELKAAADKEDAEATKKAFGKLSMSCMGCHKAHKK